MSTTLIIKRTIPSSYGLPMLIIGVLLFVFGFFTWLNGTLITFAKVPSKCRISTRF